VKEIRHNIEFPSGYQVPSKHTGLLHQNPRKLTEEIGHTFILRDRFIDKDGGPNDQRKVVLQIARAKNKGK